MSLSATGRRRPLQSKARQNPFLKRASSSFSGHARTKPGLTTDSVAKRVKTTADAEDDDEILPHGSLVNHLSNSSPSQNVLALMQHIQDCMFDDVPDRASGMNSVRIAEVLNFRKDLVPIISIAHLHALSPSPTKTDREIATLVTQGIVRRISIPGRGKGGAPIGDGLVTFRDLETIVNNSALKSDLCSKYLTLVRDHPTSPGITTNALSNTEVSQLVAAGLMTSTSALATSVGTVSRSGGFSLGTASSSPVSFAGTTAPTGSHAAVGGVDAVHKHGGGTGGIATNPLSRTSSNSISLNFSIPGTGTYLRLLTESRSFLLQLISKSSPKHKEVLRDMLRERWDSGFAPGDGISSAKRARGEWTGVLAGRTKKWKQFYGMRFDWALEECLGSGAVECFETGTVGLGVMITS